MDFGDHPAQPRVIPWKLILIIGGGVVVALGIIFGVLFVTRKDSGTTSQVVLTGKTVQEAKSPSVSGACANALDPEVCRMAEIKSQAILEKKSDGCAVLKDAELDDCLWGVATVAKDISSCEKMMNKDLSLRCVNEVSTSIALAASDSALCDKIEDVQAKALCGSILQSSSIEKDCSGENMDCEYARVLAAANKAQDADICIALDPNRAATCRSEVLVNDPDRDGLDSSQEIVLYQTDPRNADTDGDGYLDGDEVKSGYDPLKK
jgi:hypothetical protein